MIGSLSGEAEAAAKTLELSELISERSVTMILQHLDMAYANNKTDQLGSEFANFLDFSWNRHSSIEKFIVCFHSRLDQIAEININTKLKGHLLLRQAEIDNQEHSLIVGAYYGSYEVKNISAALREAYRYAPSQQECQSSSVLINNVRRKIIVITYKTALINAEIREQTMGILSTPLKRMLGQQVTVRLLILAPVPL